MYYYNHIFVIHIYDYSRMKNTKQQLIIDQVDRKLNVFSPLKTVSIPGKGWIHTVRKALNMSLRQLGERLNINPSSVQDIERRESEGAITIKALREAAAAMDMQLVYGLIPKDGSIEAMIEKRAEELATQIVQRTSQTMALEDQENTQERIKKAIKQQADELKYELPRTLWD
jgi:predicted DNA-binding mobile mystery protein A